MAKRKVFNPTSSPVPTSIEGHSLGGGDWGMVDLSDEVAAASHDAGLLVSVEDRDNPEPGAVEQPDESAVASTGAAATAPPTPTKAATRAATREKD